MPIKIKEALPPPPLLKAQNPPPPPRGRNFMGMGVFQQKEQKIPGAHKLGAAISGPRIAGGKITDMRFFFCKTPDIPLRNAPLFINLVVRNLWRVCS